MATLTTNRLSPPPGYRKPYASAAVFSVWNGAPGLSPASQLLGARQTLTVSAVPADLTTMTLSGPDGVNYLFQFVYNASTQTQGIKIPLPLSGASTPAQVQAAISAVIGQASAFTFGGVKVTFPWFASVLSATAAEVDWTIAGPIVSTATPAGITAATVYQFSPTGYRRVVPFPAMAGPVAGFLPG